MGNNLNSGSLAHSMGFGANGENRKVRVAFFFSFYEVILHINKSHEAGPTRSPIPSYGVPSW